MVRAVSLPAGFLDRPFTHRARHDKAAGVIENSPAAIRAAVAEGFGIEVDVQLTADGAAVVFHDDALARLTGAEGDVRDKTLAEMEALPLLGSADGAGSASLPDVLQMIAGKVPLVIELKDQSRGNGAAPPALESAVAEALAAYDGPVAVMSFNPHMVAHLAELAPDIPRGLTTCAFPAEDWPETPEATRAALRQIPDIARTGASFISHQVQDLTSPRVAEIKAQGLAVLCWTVRSPSDAAMAHAVADQITFEGFTPT